MGGATSTQPGTVPRVFVVEDEAIIAMELLDRLAQFGYRACGHAANGEQALRTIVEAKPDVVLMDIHLGPGIDGIETARRLQETHDIPVVFLTAFCDVPLVEQAARVDAFGYVPKPFTDHAVRAALAMALARHGAASGLRDANAMLRREVTEGRDIREQLQTLVLTDALTGVPNQRAFRGRLDQLLAEGARGRSFALVLCDIDHFKAVNDTHGHVGGDQAIVAFSTVLRHHVRKTDFVARYGGEEFAVIYTDVSESRAAELAEQLRLAVRGISVPCGLTASFGVCAYSHAFEGTTDALIRAADVALYRAKADGRDRVVSFGQTEQPSPA